jgi:hypothetical protein
LLTFATISSKDCGAASSAFAEETFPSGLPNRQMMTFAAAALRENFRAVNADRPVDTSSIKHTQTVSALSISVSTPAPQSLEEIVAEVSKSVGMRIAMAVFRTTWPQFKLSVAFAKRSRALS